MAENITQYKEIQLISDKKKSKVYLVMSPDETTLAIKKCLYGKTPDVYNKLKDVISQHIPRIYVIEENPEFSTIIEEYIEGLTIQDILDNGDSITEGFILDVTNQLCEAVKQLHSFSQPIIHRDIKPANLIVSKDKVLKLIDFDASREFKNEISKDTVYLGTMDYAPPEQFGFSQTDARSDIYAIGMLLIELMKQAEKDGELLKHRKRINQIIAKCTMFDPDQRYQNIEELQKDIRFLGRKKIMIPVVTSFVAFLLIVSLISFKNWETYNMNQLPDDTREEQELTTTPIDQDNIQINAETSTIMDAVIANPMIDYYKNKKFSEDLKIYIVFNDAEKVEYLSLLNYGRISQENYFLDGHILTLKKEYLNTLPNNYYELSIGFDKGNAATMTFEVHAEEEASVYGEYRLSHYKKEFYKSKPESFILLVYNINNARIIGLSNGEGKIDSKYYTIEDNGYAVTLDKKYMVEMDVGTIFNVTIELDNGVNKSLSVQILEKPIIKPTLDLLYYYYSIASPEDIEIKVHWNDAKAITNLLPVASKDPQITKENYIITDSGITIKKEVLEGVSEGDYEWSIIYDTGGENMFRITITK